MPHLGHDVPQTMVTLLTKAVGAFVLLVLFFIFRYIFELEFTCSCTPGGIHVLGILYMIIPPWIIYLMLYAMSNKYQKQWRNTNCCHRYLSFIGQQVLHLLSIALIWIAAVLIDGDWYVCIMGNLDERYMKIPCKKKDNLTYDENMFIIQHKNDSITYGLVLTLGGAAFWVVWSWCLIKGKCCEPYYKRFYKDQLSHEMETNVKAALIEIARDRSKAITQEPIRIIRESEIEPKGTTGENVTGNSSRSNVDNEWNSISNLFFYESERKESYEVSLFNKHLQAVKERTIQQSLQEMAEEEAEITNQGRFAKFISERTQGLGGGELRAAVKQEGRAASMSDV